MSKDIIIQEGGVGRQLSVDKLRTALVEGGTCLWVPEDAVALGRKTITEDGTYKAVDDELYGYSQVTVRGIGKTTGKVSAGNLPSNPGNNEYITGTDGNGNITFTLLPSSIKVTVKPDKKVYVPNELLDYTGIVVKAYDANGSEIDTIPFEQLIFPMSRTDGPMIPEGSESTDGKIRANVLATVPNGNYYIYPFPLDYQQGSDGRIYGRTIGTPVGEISAPPALLATRYNGYTYMARIDQNGGRFREYGFRRDPDTGEWSNNMTSTGTVPYDEFYKLGWGYYYSCEDIPMSTADPTEYRPSGMVETGAHMEVPVQWVRDDGDTLETTFNIEVTVNEGE